MALAEPKWPNGTQRCARREDGRGFEPKTSINACGLICKYVGQKGLAAMLTSVLSAGVTPEMNLGIEQERMQWDAPWFWNPERMSPEGQKQGYQWLHEKDLCPPKIKKNEPLSTHKNALK